MSPYGGLGQPRPDQRLLGISRAGDGPAPSNVLINPVIIITPGRGTFVYAPTVGAGNLIASIAAMGGTDRYGNAYLAGVTTYFNTGSWAEAVQLFAGAVRFWFATSEAGPYSQETDLALSFLNASLPVSPFLNADGSFAVGSATGPGTGVTLWYAPSADATGATDTAAINYALAQGFNVWLLPGAYYLESVVTLGAGQFIRGAGKNATVVNWVGTGDCFRVTSAASSQIGGGLSELTVNGSGGTAPSTGIHAGDIHSLNFDNVMVQSFLGTGSINWHFDNTTSFTEGLRLRACESRNGTQHVVFDVSGASTSTGSFGYSDLDMQIEAQANQDGLVVQNGAILYHSTVRLKGDFPGSSSAVANAVLRITGSIPAGHTGGNSTVNGCHLEILAECSPGGTDTPQTIVFGTLGANSLVACEGILDFVNGASAFTPTNYTQTGAPGTFLFEGIIRGDGNLAPIASGLGTATAPATIAAKQYSRSLIQSGGASNGAVFVNDGDFFRMQLVSNTTISLNPGSAACLPGPQRKTIILQQAAAGGFTVTWPSNASPTTSAPSVVWAGGVAPTMTAAASAVDVYKLETLDGATWYGQAIQNVS